MRIHDKFVIELAEVIKAYGNDYRVEEPFHLPCDYKFYEIAGVAICEESFKKMKRLEDEINDVLNKIRAEIEEYKSRTVFGIGIKDLETGRQVALDNVLGIIDKYKGDQK